MRILITTLSGHRIDERLADYCYEALKDHKTHVFSRGTQPSVKKHDAVWVFNGLNDSERSKGIIKKAEVIPTFYFHDDWTLPTFDCMTTISQFEGMSNHHFQISELSVFDKKWDEPVKEHKTWSFCYWGHAKKEREKEYIRYVYPLDKKSSLFIGDFRALKGTHVAYERDMDRLYKHISNAKYTVVFGDEMHNGRSIPLRVYEAAMCGLVVFFDRKLVEGQEYFVIPDKYIVNDYKDIQQVDFEEFKIHLLRDSLSDARERVRRNLDTIIELTETKAKK